MDILPKNIIGKLDANIRTRIEDGKFLQVLINLCPENADKAIELINKYGINKAMHISKLIGEGNKVEQN